MVKHKRRGLDPKIIATLKDDDIFSDRAAFYCFGLLDTDLRGLEIYQTEKDEKPPANILGIEINERTKGPWILYKWSQLRPRYEQSVEREREVEERYRRENTLKNRCVRFKENWCFGCWCCLCFVGVH